MQQEGGRHDDEFFWWQLSWLCGEVTHVHLRQRTPPLPFILFPCVKTIGGRNCGVIFVDSSSRRQVPPPTCASRRRHDGIFVVAAGELGYPSRRINTINVVFYGGAEKILFCRVYTCMTCSMHTKKTTHKKGKKHRTPSKKGKKQEHWQCSNVYTFFTFTLKEITA